MSTTKEHDQGLNILSLDGGGLRGLSSLLILRECMTRLQHQLGLDKRPEVYEHFDIIGGTGTGGISAIMLGRLRIPLDQAIDQFEKLATDIFSDKENFSVSGSSAFKSDKMEQALKSIIRETTGDENEKMTDNRPDAEKCKTVVFAMSRHNMNAGPPRMFRSYQARASHMPDCPIWEALSATSAHPDLFESIDIGADSPKESFIDGGRGCNNPLPHILSEVKVLYPDRYVGCIISIGAGHARTIPDPSPSPLILRKSVIEAMKAIATGSEEAAQHMAIQFGSTQGVYFRLNVDRGMQSVELGDWERLDQVAAHTRGYMQLAEVTERVDRSVEAIKNKKCVVHTRHIDEHVPARVNQTDSTGVKICPRPTPLFVGREEPVQQASAYLMSDVTEQKIFVIHGLGGSGKTQMALRIVENTREHWSDIVFLDATSLTTIETTLKDFAMRKALGDTHNDALHWLASTTTRWLLVIDNADDPRVDVIDYLPECSGGSILITTRNRDLVELAFGPESDCSVSGMELDEALQLLLKVSRRDNEKLGKAEMEAAQQLLEDFGCLPLAITQAGGYVQKTQCSFAQYRELFLQQPRTMLQQHSKIRIRLDKYERTVFDTWLLSYGFLSVKAKSLLAIAAYMHRNQITAEIFRCAALNINGLKSSIPLPNVEQWAYNRVKGFLCSLLDSSGGWDGDAFLNMTSEILSVSLIQYDRATKTYALHPLVQTWVRMVAPVVEGHICTAYVLAASIGWEETSENYALLRSLQFHVHGVLEQCPDICTTVAACLAYVCYWSGQWEQASLWQARVLQAALDMHGKDHHSTLSAMVALSNTYLSQGRLKEAEELQVQVLDAMKRVHGLEHPDTLGALTNLANSYSDQGRWKEAEELRAQVLDASRRVLGAEHPNALIAMNNLAITYSDQGRHQEAEELRVQVLDARKRVLGAEHPDTLMAMNALATTYSYQGRQKEAEELRVQVLDATRRVLGPEHPDTLMAINNLAITYSDQGRLKEAEELQVQVLDAKKRVLGAEHPDRLIAMNNLAITYSDQGRHQQAEELRVQVLDARKRMLGLEHPDTLIAMNNLAITYSDQGRQKEAEELRVQVLNARKRVLGVEHPDTLSALNNLAITYSNQGRQKEAEELQTKVLDARKRVLGVEHPDTLMAMNNLAITYSDQGRHKDSEELQVQVLNASKRVLGVEHPDTLRAMNNLAITYSKQGRRKETEELRIQVLDAMKRVLGPEHPSTLSVMNNLACSYSRQGRWKEAEELQVQVLHARKRILGFQHPGTLRSMRRLAATYEALGQSHKTLYDVLTQDIQRLETGASSDAALLG